MSDIRATISGPYYRDGHCLSTVLRLLRERGDPQSKHICGDYETVARCTSGTWDRDSEIIVDALNTYHGTGQTPRQLAEQRADLLAALKEFVPKNISLNNANVPDDQVVHLNIALGTLRRAQVIIAKAEGGAA